MKQQQNQEKHVLIFDNSFTMYSVQLVFRNPILCQFVRGCNTNLLLCSSSGRRNDVIGWCVYLLPVTWQASSQILMT